MPKDKARGTKSRSGSGDSALGSALGSLIGASPVDEGTPGGPNPAFGADPNNPGTVDFKYKGDPAEAIQKFGTTNATIPLGFWGSLFNPTQAASIKSSNLGATVANQQADIGNQRQLGQNQALEDQKLSQAADAIGKVHPEWDEPTKAQYVAKWGADNVLKGVAASDAQSRLQTNAADISDATKQQNIDTTVARLKNDQEQADAARLLELRTGKINRDTAESRAVRARTLAYSAEGSSNTDASTQRLNSLIANDRSVTGATYGTPAERIAAQGALENQPNVNELNQVKTQNAIKEAPSQSGSIIFTNTHPALPQGPVFPRIDSEGNLVAIPPNPNHILGATETLNSVFNKQINPDINNPGYNPITNPGTGALRPATVAPSGAGSNVGQPIGGPLQINGVTYIQDPNNPGQYIKTSQPGSE